MIRDFGQDVEDVKDNAKRDDVSKAHDRERRHEHEAQYMHG